MLQTVSLLAANLTYLTKVVEALTEKHVLLQTDFYELLDESSESASSALDY